VHEVSVVVPVRDAASSLGEQLEALAGQDFTGHWELIVVDDGSRDRSAAVVESFADRFDLTLVRTESTRGVSRSRNLGVAQARADKIVFCDADDVVDAGWLRAMSHALDDADLVGGRLDHDMLNRSDQPFRVQADGLPSFLGIPFSLAASLGVRAGLFERLGGFDADLLRSSCEDIDLAFRAARLGVRCTYVESARVNYRLRRGVRSIARQQFRNGRGEAVFCWAYRSDGLLDKMIRSEARAAGWLVVRCPQVLWSHAYRSRILRFGVRKMGWVRGVADLLFDRRIRRAARAAHRSPGSDADRDAGSRSSSRPGVVVHRARRRIRSARRRRGVGLVRWRRRAPGSVLDHVLGRRSVHPPTSADDERIEDRSAATDRVGSLPLWTGYGEPEGRRTPNKVRTPALLGRVYRHLVRVTRPDLVVEFGTAFGVSGMYWLSGLEANGHGRLLTFEPNEAWRRLAVANLGAVGTRFDSVSGTFEEQVDDHLHEGDRIDITFIDAIHRSEFISEQFELVVARSSHGGLVLVDDIDFSDDMRGCWEGLSLDERVRSSVEIENRVGVMELW
jgi:glycosyltransferase involved in cell wall biosynthesis